MAQVFNYRLRVIDNGLELTIEEFRVKTLILSSICALATILVPAWLIAQVGVRSVIWVITPFAAFLTYISILFVIQSHLRRTLTLLPSELNLRSTFFFPSRVRKFDPTKASLAIGGGSHGMPRGLVLWHRKKRIVLANSVESHEVQKILLDTSNQGFNLPAPPNSTT